MLMPREQSLVAFVRKRDPRFKAHQAALAAGPSEAELQRRRDEAAARRLAEEELARTYVPQAWEQQAPVEVDSEFEEDSEMSDSEVGSDEGELEQADEVEEEEEEEDEPDSFECFACDKVFRTQPALENHEKSKKHRCVLAGSAEVLLV